MTDERVTTDPVSGESTSPRLGTSSLPPTAAEGHHDGRDHLLAAAGVPAPRTLLPEVVIEANGTIALVLDVQHGVVLAHLLSWVIQTTCMTQSAARLAGVGEEQVAAVCHVDGFVPAVWNPVVIDLMAAKAELVDRVDVPLLKLVGIEVDGKAIRDIDTDMVTAARTALSVALNEMGPISRRRAKQLIDEHWKDQP